MNSYAGACGRIFLAFIFSSVVGFLIVVTIMPSYVSATTSNPVISSLTPNQIAAGGPLTGNLSLVEGEQKCINSIKNQTTWAAWYPTMASTEHGGSERAAVFDCAHFGGSFTKPNQVYAYESPTSLGGVPSYLVTRGPNEIYVSGGAGSLALPGPYIAKMQAGSLKELWSTPLSNNNVTGDWLIPGATNYPADGSIAVAQGQYVYKVNASTGAVEKVVALPSGKNPPGDSNFDGMNAFSDGTLVLKTQNRVAGCTNQGYSFFFCTNQSKAAPSVAVAVDPNTFKVKSFVQLPEMIPGRNTVTQFQGKDYMYLFGTSKAFRYEWNGQNLTLDNNWGPVPYLLPGQSAGTASAIMGNWVVSFTNTSPSNKSMSVVAISQADPKKLVRINPIPLESGQQSEIPSMGSVDLPNNRIYALDYFAGKVVAINFNQETGNMTVAWGPVNERTSSFLTLIGPKESRVLIGTNINPNTTQQLIQEALLGQGFTYTEQILWRDAASGKVLAASDYFPAMSPGILVTPGYGGLIYELLYNGHIMALQVAPALKTTGNSTAG
jgi:hypothetical protein